MRCAQDQEYGHSSVRQEMAIHDNLIDDAQEMAVHDNLIDDAQEMDGMMHKRWLYMTT